jgi:predicted ester cyclase
MLALKDFLDNFNGRKLRTLSLACKRWKIRSARIGFIEQSTQISFVENSTIMPVQNKTKEEINKEIVIRWFTNFWGKNVDLSVVDEIADENMVLHYSLHEPRKGHADIKAFMRDFRAAFPDLNFWGAADLIAEGDYVVGRWEGGGTHTGSAFSDFLIGALPPATGRKMHFTGTTVLKVKDGRIVEEIGLDDGVTALQQLGLLKAVQ